MRLYHPNLGREITVPDNKACIATLEEVGWKPAPEPERTPGVVPEPVRYEPVTDKPSGRQRRKPAESTAEETAES